jgi:ankyrin repeat protein
MPVTTFNIRHSTYQNSTIDKCPILTIDVSPVQNGCTALHFASGRGHREATSMLLKGMLTADVNVKEDVCGDTPLHWYARSTYQIAVAILDKRIYDCVRKIYSTACKI